jgi:iron complex transport system ATP-binding protein
MLLLRELAEKERKSILLSTHDMESAIRMGSRFWLMSKDRPFLSGEPQELIRSGVFDDFFNLSAYPEWSGKRYI